jgi:hypothetical protein
MVVLVAVPEKPPPIPVAGIETPSEGVLQPAGHEIRLRSLQKKMVIPNVS